MKWTPGLNSAEILQTANLSKCSSAFFHLLFLVHWQFVSQLSAHTYLLHCTVYANKHAHAHSY